MLSKKEKKEKLALQLRLGIHIRNFRKAKGLTQQQVEKRSGIKRNNIARIEIGKKNPSVFVLKKLCKGLKTDLPELLKGFK